MRWYQEIKKRFKSQEPATVCVEDCDEITDEIERSLWDIKEALDLPTEEIEISLESRRNSIAMRFEKHSN
tara:strand:+ start:580 stop:789 length:210 start_codon:yes stop_codon:yes gene_type:complete